MVEPLWDEIGSVSSSLVHGETVSVICLEVSNERMISPLEPGEIECANNAEPDESLELSDEPVQATILQFCSPSIR